MSGASVQKKAVSSPVTNSPPGGADSGASGCASCEAAKASAGGGEGVVATMIVAVAGQTFLFHVRDFPVRGDLAVAPRHAPATERGKPQQTNEIDHGGPRGRGQQCSYRRARQTVLANLCRNVEGIPPLPRVGVTDRVAVGFGRLADLDFGKRFRRGCYSARSCSNRARSSARPLAATPLAVRMR